MIGYKKEHCKVAVSLKSKDGQRITNAVLNNNGGILHNKQ